MYVDRKTAIKLNFYNNENTVVYVIVQTHNDMVTIFINLVVNVLT